MRSIHCPFVAQTTFSWAIILTFFIARAALAQTSPETTAASEEAAASSEAEEIAEESTPAGQSDAEPAAPQESESTSAGEPAPETEAVPETEVDSAEDADASVERTPLGAIEDMSLEDLLSEPVTTASGGTTEERVLSAANVTVVTRKDIQLHQWGSLAEVLASVPGLYIIDDHVMPSVSVRGISGGMRAGTRIIKIMINGVAVSFRPELSTFLGPEFIPMDAVHQIEIVQGPLSALYGANAFIATVNVITRQPDGKSKNVLAARATILKQPGGGGSVFLVRGDDDLGLTAAFSFDWIDRSGLEVQTTFPAQDPFRDRYELLFADSSQGDVTNPLTGFLQLHVGKPEDDHGRFMLQGGLQRHDAVGEFQVNTALSHRSRYSLINYWLDARWVREWSRDFQLTASAGFAAGTPTRDYKLFVTADPGVYYEPRYSYHVGTAAAHLDWAPFGDQLRLRFGLEGEMGSQDVLFYSEIFQIPFGEREPGDRIDLIGEDKKRSRFMGEGGATVQVMSVPLPDFLPDLRLTGSARVDLIRYGAITFPVQQSWRIGAVYQWSDSLVTKVVGGQAFQIPSAVQMFANSGLGRSNNVVGNANVRPLGFEQLRPQTVSGLEGIVNVRISNIFMADVGVYFQVIDNRIEFEQLATDFIAVNTDTRQFLGGSASLKLDLDRVDAYATVTAQGQFVEGELVDYPPALYPNFFGTAGVNVHVPEVFLRGNVHLRWAGERGASQSNTLLNDGFYTLDPYALVDLTVSTTEIELWDGTETQLSFSVRNLIGTRYSEPGFAGFDIPQLGRSFWIELRQLF